ncbi:MAG TPA: hypothetical protein VFH70_13750 [Acidimicrobiales bacterium]|nr:hypothetical protein [Acidimicrobiales bacterium]
MPGIEQAGGGAGGPGTGLPDDPLTLATASTVGLGMRVTGDTSDRIQIAPKGIAIGNPGAAALPTNLGVSVTLDPQPTAGLGEAALINAVVNNTSTESSPFTVSTIAGAFRGHMGHGGATPTGTTIALASHALGDGAANSSNELAGLFLECASDVAVRQWLIDATLSGPVGLQPNLFTGAVFCANNYYNGSPVNGPGVGMVVVSKPGAGGGDLQGSRNTAQTYPMDIGLCVAGWSGTSSKSTFTNAFTVGIQVGGHASGWMASGDRSSVGFGIAVEDYTNNGILIQSAQATGAAGLVINHNTGQTGDLIALQVNNVSVFEIIANGTLKFTAAANNVTGTGSAALGANCPAVTPGAPYKWLLVQTSDGSNVYIPAWK